MTEIEYQNMEKLIKALNEINKTIFVNTVYIGSEEYFKIRSLCVDTIRQVGGKVE